MSGGSAWRQCEVNRVRREWLIQTYRPLSCGKRRIYGGVGRGWPSIMDGTGVKFGLTVQRLRGVVGCRHGRLSRRHIHTPRRNGSGRPKDWSLHYLSVVVEYWRVSSLEQRPPTPPRENHRRRNLPLYLSITLIRNINSVLNNLILTPKSWDTIPYTRDIPNS